MKLDFVKQECIDHVINGFNNYYNHVLKIGKVDAADFKNFMEPYFVEAGYRDKIINAKFVKKSKGEGYNILIFHNAGVGDFILLSSAIREIRRIYLKAHITLMVIKNSLSMAECCPYVDSIIIYDSSNLKVFDDFFPFYAKNVEIAKKMLKKRFDICFNFGQYANSSLVAYMSGAKECISMKRKSGSLSKDEVPVNFFEELSTSLITLTNQMKPLHYAERCLYLIESYHNTNISDKKIEVWYTPLDVSIVENYIENVSGKIYATSMGGVQNCKHWPPENYAALMNKILAEEPDVTFVILGGINEIEYGDTVCSLVDSKHIINLTNKIPYRQSAALLSFCDYYIGNDTGTMHAAAACNIPVLSPNCFSTDLELTINSSILKYFPYQVPSVIVQPEHALSECKNKLVHTGCTILDKPHCIIQITPDTMFKAFKILKEQVSKNIKKPLYVH